MEIKKIRDDHWECRVPLRFSEAYAYGSTREEALQRGIKILVQYYGITEQEAMEMAGKEK